MLLLTSEAIVTESCWSGQWRLWNKAVYKNRTKCYSDNWLDTSIKKMKLDFMQPSCNTVFQEISTVESELPLFDMVNVKGIVYNIWALETGSKDNKLLWLKKVSLKDNTGSLPITFYNELRKQLKEVNFEIIEVRITKYVTQKSLRTTQFTEILEIFN